MVEHHELPAHGRQALVFPSAKASRIWPQRTGQRTILITAIDKKTRSRKIPRRDSGDPNLSNSSLKKIAQLPRTVHNTSWTHNKNSLLNAFSHSSKEAQQLLQPQVKTVFKVTTKVNGDEAFPTRLRGDYVVFFGGTILYSLVMPLALCGRGATSPTVTGSGRSRAIVESYITRWPWPLYCQLAHVALTRSMHTSRARIQACRLQKARTQQKQSQALG